MDSLVTLYHGGRVEIDAYGSVTFDGMKIVTMLFVERPSFDQLLARACEEIRFPVAVGEVERPPFSWTQSRMNAENAVDLATTHVHAFGHLVRCDIFFYTQILF